EARLLTSATPGREAWGGCRQRSETTDNWFRPAVSEQEVFNAQGPDPCGGSGGGANPPPRPAAPGRGAGRVARARDARARGGGEARVWEWAQEVIWQLSGRARA